MYGQETGFGQFMAPTVISAAIGAANYLQERVTEFYALGPKLLAMMKRASRTAAAARGRGLTTDYDRARALLREISLNYSEWGKTKDRLDSALAKVPGLGVAPAVILAAIGAGTAIAIAAAMTAILRKSTSQERLLKLIEQGVLSPEEAARLDIEAEAPTGIAGLVAGVGGIARWAVLGGALLLLGPMLLQKTTRRRRGR